MGLPSHHNYTWPSWPTFCCRKQNTKNCLLFCCESLWKQELTKQVFYISRCSPGTTRWHLTHGEILRVNCTPSPPSSLEPLHLLPRSISPSSLPHSFPPFHHVVGSPPSHGPSLSRGFLWVLPCQVPPPILPSSPSHPPSSSSIPPTPCSSLPPSTRAPSSLRCTLDSPPWKNMCGLHFFKNKDWRLYILCLHFIHFKCGKHNIFCCKKGMVTSKQWLQKWTCRWRISAQQTVLPSQTCCCCCCCSSST